MMKKLLIVMGIFLFSFSLSMAQVDPGEPDSLIFQDDVYVPYNPGQWSTAKCEAYFATDDSVGDFGFAITWFSADGQISPDSVVWREGLEGWDETWDSIYVGDELIRFLGWYDLGGPDNDPLFTNMQRVVGFEIWFSISPTATQQIVVVDSTQDPIIGRPYFSLFDGVVSFTPIIVPGSIYYGIQVGVDESELDLPTGYSLHQNFPNPFNAVTKIDFELPERNMVTIEVFNILGQNVRTLISEQKQAGRHSVMWDGVDNSGQAVPSGLYFYRLVAGSFTATDKMMLLK